MPYPLGWSVIPSLVVRRERWPGGYQGKHIPVVQLGQEVLPDQPVLRLERTEKTGPALTRNTFSPHLSLPTSQPGITSKMSLNSIRDGVHSGEGVEVLPAGIHGRIVEITARGGVVIETRAALLQGTIGAGGQVAGVLTMWKSGGIGQAQPMIPPGAILIVPGPLTFALLQQAMNSGVVGVIASSINLRDLEGFLRTDLLQLIGSDDIEHALQHIPSMTLLLTEGLGNYAMPARIMNLLSQYQGAVALLSGITAPHKGILPELVISLPAQEQASSTLPDPMLTVGTQVRVCGGEREGTIGVVDYLFTYQQLFASGIRARSLRLRCEDGSQLVIPITLVERIA